LRDARPQTDPAGPADGEFKVTSGGSHGTDAYHLRSANRGGAPPGTRSWITGFRVVAGGAPLSTGPARGARARLQPRSAFLPAAPAAVRQWRYRPTVLNGEAVEVVAPVVVHFTLNR
jgi:hypothetical protein